MPKFFSCFKDNRISKVLSRLVEDRALDIVLAIVSGVLVIALLLSTLSIITKYNAHLNDLEFIAGAKDTFYSAHGYQDGIRALQEQNSDVKAWLLIQGTEFDAPVCQAENDSFYLSHNYLGQKDAFGSLFFSSDDTISINDPDQNLVIYGKSGNGNRVFDSLDRFLDVDFYSQNHIIHLYTKYKDTPYVVFAVMIIPEKPDVDGKFLDVTRSSFGSDRQFNQWLEQVNNNNIISTEIAVRPHNNLLTLVTTSDSFDGARLVVMARQLERFEGSNLDTGTVKIKNGKPQENN